MRKALRKALLCIPAAMLSLGTAHAELRPVTPQCLLHAVSIHRLPLSVVLALMHTEGGSPGSDHLNDNGSHDLGVMQVNDRTWLAEIATHDFHGDRATAKSRLRDDGCYNVMWGTEIFARYVDEAQGRYWLAVGYYNSHNDKPRIAYTRTVISKYLEVKRKMRAAIERIKMQHPDSTLDLGGY